MPRKTTSKTPIVETSVLPNKSNIFIDKLNILIEPLKARHRRHYKDSIFHFWADIILAGILLALLIIVVRLVFWQPQAEFSLVSNFTNARILSGQSEELVIAYKNGEDGQINGVSLKLDLPENFIVESALPQGAFKAEANTFMLGDLNKNARGEIRLKGVPRGEINSRQTIELNLSYQFGQIRKQLLDSIVYTLDGSVMEVNLDLPTETYKNVSFNGSAEVKNLGKEKLDNAFLSFPSTDWEIIPDEGNLENGRLALLTINPGSSVKINFSVVSAKEEVATKSFVVQGIMMIGDKSFKQLEITRNISITEMGLYLNGVFSNKALSEKSIGLELNLKNNDPADISNLTLGFESRRNTTAVTNVTTTNPDFSATNNILSYNQNLKVGEDKKIEAIINFDKLGSSLNDFVNLNVLVSYTMDNKTFKYAVPLSKLKINSNLTVNSAAYYYGPQGDQLGIGPIPPKVDIPTTYWVIWEANNLGNDLSNFEVSADLPINVVWLDQKSLVAGDISYSPVSRRILWQVDKIDKTGGNYRVSFAISLVPRNQDIGTVPEILSNIQFKASDLYTGDIISKNLANITTNIPEDRKAAGKGKVEPLE